MPGSNAAADVFGDFAAVYVNGSDLASPAVQPQQLLQELQQDWQLDAAVPDAAGGEEPAVTPGDSSSWSAAAESWLQVAGYQQGSVYNAELSALVQDAIAAGRVAPAVLPALSAAQSQLQQLLQQEQALGDAIEELMAAAARQEAQQLSGQQQQQQQQAAVSSGGSSSSDLRQAAASAAATSGGSRTLQQVGSGPGRPGSPLQLSHKQELALLQQLVGRQLSGAKVGLAVHNFGYQGGFTGQRHFERLGLPARLLPSFFAPVALAAKAASSVGSKVSSKVAEIAAGAVSAVGSQLAALGAALQRLGRPKPARDAAGGSSSSYGLLASMQQMLGQAPSQTTEQADLQQQTEQQQQTDQQQQQQVTAAGDEGDTGPAESVSADMTSNPQPQQRYYHHLRHQQQLPEEVLQPGARPSSPDSLQLNWLAAGLAACDAAITVSPSYAQEMLLEEPPPRRRSSSGSSSRPSSPSGSSPGLAALLASKQLRGIMNGLDTGFWDPACDPLLPAAVRYSPASAGPGKAAAKALLQRRLGLAVDPAAPLFAFVGRLTYQKGVDVILAALPQVLGQQQPRQTAEAGLQQSSGSSSSAAGTPPSESLQASAADPGPQLVLLGSGEPWMEAVLGQLGRRYPGAAVGVPDFNEPLAHLLMAGADFLLVPSRFEPCGLVALAALRYGAVPLATATGGLADIVTPAVGFSLVPPGPEGDTAGFRRGVADLAATMKLAAAEYGGPGHEARRDAAMAVDVSWEAPCTAWEQVLLQLAGQQPGAVADTAAADDASMEAGGGEDDGDASAASVPAVEGVPAVARR
jgi:glycogen synthase